MLVRQSITINKKSKVMEREMSASALASRHSTRLITKACLRACFARTRSGSLRD